MNVTEKKEFIRDYTFDEIAPSGRMALPGNREGDRNADFEQPGGFLKGTHPPCSAMGVMGDRGDE